MVIDWLESKGKSLAFRGQESFSLSLSLVGFMLSCVAVLINMLARDEMPDAGGERGKREESRSRERTSLENVLFLWQRNLATSNAKAY